MAGASQRHTLIAANIIATLHVQLKGRSCSVHTGDLRVKVSSTGLYTYPDVVVLCGKPQYDDAAQDTVSNPAVIVEVLSKSTESYDRGAKFQHYRRLESLTDYLLVSQDTATVEHRVRQADDRWLLGIYQGLHTTVPLSSIDCELPLAEVYDKIEWPDEDAAGGWLRFVKEPSESYLA
jgi:Uma2 family endonuclease